MTALDAAAALLGALDRARRADDLTLRDFRADVTAAELTSRYAAIAAGRAGQDAGPLLVAGLAWQLAGRSSMEFHDGRRGAPGDRLTTAIDRWSRTGQLYANARDLPSMENLPEDRVKAVITGRQVQARGADLDHLRQVVARAADLSAGLADARYRAAGTGPQPRRHETEWHDRKAKVPGMAERLLNHAQAVDRDITGIWSSPQAAREVPPSR